MTEQPLEQEQDLDETAVEIPQRIVATNHTMRSDTEQMADLQDNKLNQNEDLAELDDIVRDSRCSSRTFEQRRNTV